MTDDDDRFLSCWRWKREGCEDTFWGFHYPGAAEQYDTHEVTILFWDHPSGTEATTDA